MLLLALLACTRPDPGAPDDTAEPVEGVEVCNGEDDDGDGVVDEHLLLTWYVDADGDGFGTDATAAQACALPAGGSVVGGDCDDADLAVHPDAVEACDTPIDDDCDGAVNPDGAAGCVDTYADADGDGLGDGPAVCRCDPTDHLLSNDDCDGGDIDRGADCTEGAVVPLAGARVLDDDDDLAWALVGAAELDGVPGDELVLHANASVAALPLPGAGDATIGATLLGTIPLTEDADRALGDLDGDGVADLLEANNPGEVDPHDPDLFTLAPVLRGWHGPLIEATAPAWTWELAPLVTRWSSESLFAADLDGDGVDEAWYASGTSIAPYDGEAALWRATEADAREVVRTEDPGALHQVASLGDVDGDGLADLGVLRHVGFDETIVSVHAGPVVDALPTASADIGSEELLGIVALGDLDGDGYDDIALRGERIHVLRGPPRSGEAPDLAAARIGPESDDLDESALFVTAGDVGADGTRDLVVTDTYWPGRFGADPLKGAVYVFDGLPDGVVDVRAAATRAYGTTYGALGAYPSVLDDGRLLVGAHLEDHADGRGVYWLLEGLGD